MCTLSWWVEGDAYGILFNRDEKRTRSRGLPPQISVIGHKTSILSPIDPDAYGTWTGVNAHGLIVALLNNYPFYQAGLAKPVSRGQLVLDLLASGASNASARQALDQVDLRHYCGFVLFIMDPSCVPLIVAWDGRDLATWTDRSVAVLTTSSERREDCIPYRERLFAEQAADDPARLQRHLHFNALDPALGPLMVRDDACTDSLTRITVRQDRCAMDFRSFSGIPPAPGPCTVHELKRDQPE